MALQKAFQSKDARRGKNREGATGTEKGVQNGGVREPEEGREGEPIDDHKREELQKMTPVQPGEGIAKRCGSLFCRRNETNSALQ